MIEALRYRLDNIIARGTLALLAILSLAMTVLIAVLLLAMVVLDVSPGAGASLLDKAWTIFIFTFDPSGVPYSAGVWPYRIILLFASLGGVFILSILIGIVANGFSITMENLRKGKSSVVEKGHTIVLGWGEQVFSVVQELIYANESKDSACIVVLAEHDKVKMEDAFRARIINRHTTRIVCRSGSTINTSDLTIVRPQFAKSIIVLASEGISPDESDARTIKTLLALKSLHNVESRTTVVATIQVETNLEVAELITGSDASIIPNEVIVSQMITQTCRQPGLSRVYSELLAFEGNEIYVHEVPQLVGKSFAYAIGEFDASTVIGICTHDGVILLNPPSEHLIAVGSKVVAISEDDSMFRLRSQNESVPIVNHSLIVKTHIAPPALENILILGWNERGKLIVHELEHYLVPGSTITVVDDIQGVEDGLLLDNVGYSDTIRGVHGNPTSRKTLNSLNMSSYSGVIILARTNIGVQEADARTLITLVHLRDIISSGLASDVSPTNIVSEMLDERNRKLASSDDTNDFIISNTIISLLLTQIAESPVLNRVFRELFSDVGCELYLKPISSYIKTGQPVNMATLVQSAIGRGEIAIGTKTLRNGKWKIDINQPKSEVYSFSESDFVVVIARN